MEQTGGKTILVTGGGGFLGRVIVERLVNRGFGVRSFSRGFYPELDSLGVEQVCGDIADPNAVEMAAEGVDTIFHTAAKPGVWGEYESYYQTNVQGTLNVIDVCRKRGISKLVHTSSPSVVFDGSDMDGVDESVPYAPKYHAHYPKTKAIAEQYVIDASGPDLKTIILRPHLIWGPGDNHLVPRIIARGRRLARVGDGRNLADTVYIDNAADAHILAADALEKNPSLSGNVYFISQGDPIPLWDMVDRILEAGGLPPVKRSVSVKTARLVGAVLETVYAVLKLKGEPRMTRFVAEELATAHWFDISAAKRDLGYAPAVSTEEGLRRLKSWLNAKPKEIS